MVFSITKFRKQIKKNHAPIDFKPLTVFSVIQNPLLALHYGEATSPSKINIWQFSREYFSQKKIYGKPYWNIENE